MALKYFSSDHLSSDYSDTLQSFRKACKDQYTTICRIAEELSCSIGECMDGVNINSKIVQCSNYKMSVQKLHSETASSSTHEEELEVKSRDLKLCLLKEEIKIAENNSVELKKTSEELMATCCRLEADKKALKSKVKKKHNSYLSLLIPYKTKLNCNISCEKENVYEFQFKDSKFDASIKILKEEKDSFKVIGVWPKLKCEPDIIKLVLTSKDFQGLISTFHAIFCDEVSR